MAIGRAETRPHSLYRIDVGHIFMQLDSLARSGAGGNGMSRSHKADSCPDGCINAWGTSVFGAMADALLSGARLWWAVTGLTSRGLSQAILEFLTRAGATVHGRLRKGRASPAGEALPAL